VCLI